ncbi:MAG: hypothetical protein ACE5R4_18710 [Armatimonadota bacterium]
MSGPHWEVEFTLQTDWVRSDVSRVVVELTMSGHPTVMLVPIALLDGNLAT